MTLTEIVAGLVVLAVLVSSVTIARGRFVRQWADAERELAALAAADRLLASWVPGGIEPDAIPVPASGPLEGADDCAWRTTWVNDAAARKLNSAIVRFEVMRRGRLVMTLELLKRLPSPEERR